MHRPLHLFTRCVVLCWAVRFLGAQLKNEKNETGNELEASYFYYHRPTYPRDCDEVRDRCYSQTSGGVYLIKPDGYSQPFEVYCDKTSFESWTVVLRRDNGFIDFDRRWEEYKHGFGFLSQEFWIGSERLSYLTNQKNYQLRFDATISGGSSCFVAYDLFRTSDEFGNYKIARLGRYSGSIDDCINWCSNHLVPGDCNCQRTCSNPNGCLNTCGTNNDCVCPTGLYLKGEDCVPLTECTSGCLLDNVTIAEGGIYVDVDCKRRGFCVNGQFFWDSSYMCGFNEVCDERNSVRQCYRVDASDCLDIFNTSLLDSGVYYIAPTNWPGSPWQVYCNMTDGGGWTVFQRRVDGTVDFYRNWTSYKEGFGSPDHEHWLGNEKLFYLTNQKRYTIRIDLVNLNGLPYYAKFDVFRINNETDNYRMSELGTYSGNADFRSSSVSDFAIAFKFHLNSEFSTYDNDNDVEFFYNCALNFNGGWWYNSVDFNYNCYWSNLNGLYDTSDCNDDDIWWSYLPGSDCNQYVEMKVRPY